MIARVWRGVVRLEKAEEYGRWLCDSEFGVKDYRATPGNVGAWVLRRIEGDRADFLLVSCWESREAIQAYAGADIERARYFPYDRECLIDPDPRVAHYEVLAGSGPEGAKGP
jgi:heme-degrading monooxygenase HmoA